MTETYRVSLKLQPETMRFLNRLKKEMSDEVGRRIELSELVDAICQAHERYLAGQETSEAVRARGHRGLPGHRPDP